MKEPRFTGAMSRRSLLKVSAGLAMGSAATALAARSNGESATSSAFDSKHRILIKGGTVVSMDPRVGNLVRGDVLIEGKKIVEIGPALSASAQVIDAGGMVVCPGMHDTHRHSWQGQFRHIIPSGNLLTYVSIAAGFGPLYRPEDVYIGNLITAVSNINCGVTAMLDFSHVPWSVENAVAAVQALRESGIRAVFARCQPFSMADPLKRDDGKWLVDLARLKEQYFATDDQLLTLRMGLINLEESDFEAARRLGIGVSVDTMMDHWRMPGMNVPPRSPVIKRFAEAGLLGPQVTLIHGTTLNDEAWKAIADSGTTVSIAPISDAHYMIGDGLSPVQKALDFGVRPGLSVDTDLSYSSDMWTQMRAIMAIQRLMLTQRLDHGAVDLPAPITARAVFELATAAGAHANSLAHKSGTLTPGKEADIVVLRADELSLSMNNAYGTIVMGADTGSVDTVIIAGQIRKQHGKLVGVDLARLRMLADRSRQYLFDKKGYRLDVFSDNVDPQA